MALHFTEEELQDRRDHACHLMAEDGLDGMLLFRQESMFYLVLGRKIPKLLILNDISSISQDEDLFDTVFRWPKSAKNGIFDEFPQNLRFLKIGEYH